MTMMQTLCLFKQQRSIFLTTPGSDGHFRCCCLGFLNHVPLLPVLQSLRSMMVSFMPHQFVITSLRRSAMDDSYWGHKGTPDVWKSLTLIIQTQEKLFLTVQKKRFSLILSILNGHNALFISVICSNGTELGP